MWQILKTELNYTRAPLIVGYVIASLFLVAAVVIDDWGFYNYMWNTTIAYFILMGIAGSLTINEKRYRLLAILPVTPQDVAVADGLYCLLVQLGMSMLWILFLLFRPEHLSHQVIWLGVSNIATIQIITTLFGIHYHAGFFETKKYKRLNWLLLFVFVAILVELGYLRMLKPIAQAMWQFYVSPPGAFVFVLMWIVALSLSREVYLRRKSYLA
jgi:hypothetical protein